MRKSLALIILIIITTSFWVAWYENRETYLLNGFYTFLSLTLLYSIFKIILEGAIIKKIREARMRYSIRKTISILYIIIFLALVIGIWIESTDQIIVLFGLIGAGIAISLQDFFKNFVGGIMIFMGGIYSVGDRVEINEKFGDVVDIGIMYTTLLEIKEWVAGDQATGRLTIIPNGHILSNSVNNYTKDHLFIWDEIILPITYDSDWRKAVMIIQEIVQRETKETTVKASRSFDDLDQKYFLSKKPVESAVYFKLTDNWIEIAIRYIVEVRNRRHMHDLLSRLLLTEIDKEENIKIASSTIDIIAFPDINIKDMKSKR